MVARAIRAVAPAPGQPWAVRRFASLGRDLTGWPDRPGL